MNKPKIALVFSGGGALGFAHIGALEAFEENNINIDIITGTSMGAVVGGAYASGATTHEMRHFASKISLLQVMDFNFAFIRGFLSGSGATRLIRKYIKTPNIEDFPRQFACVSADIKNDKLVVFDKGDAMTAIRASMSVPGVFVPVKYGDGYLVDGGIMNNYPDDIARKLGADIIIGIDVISDFKMDAMVGSKFGILLTSNFIGMKYGTRYKRKCSDMIIKVKQSEDIKQESYNSKCALKSINFGRDAVLEMMPQIIELIEQKTADMNK